MYSPSVSARHLAAAERQFDITIPTYTPDVVSGWVDHLSKLINDKGQQKRPLKPEEKEFIRNVRIRSKFDFDFWSRNFCTISRDGVEGGGIGKLIPWKSQDILLRSIAAKEEENEAAFDRHEPVDGILIADHKGGRQVGHTAIARAINVHRLLFWNHTRGMAASVDEDKIQELYDRDKMILDNLPWWMSQSLKFDVKSQHLELEGVGSKLLYQIASQRGGIGQGRQFDIAHITEVATFERVIKGDPRRLELEFFPALPQSRMTFCQLETTADGRGNWWHEFSERVRKGLEPRWTYVFIPWYAEPKKYRRQPPPDWKPSAVTLQHAEHVYDTSAEFIGSSYLLPKENLYWWESEYETYQGRGTLNIFLTNFAATPEESFQHSGRSSFSVEQLQEMRAKVSAPKAYELVGV